MDAYAARVSLVTYCHASHASFPGPVSLSVPKFQAFHKPGSNDDPPRLWYPYFLSTSQRKIDDMLLLMP